MAYEFGLDPRVVAEQSARQLLTMERYLHWRNTQTADANRRANRGR